MSISITRVNLYQSHARAPWQKILTPVLTSLYSPNDIHLLTMIILHSSDNISSLIRMFFEPNGYNLDHQLIRNNRCLDRKWINLIIEMHTTLCSKHIRLQAWLKTLLLRLWSKIRNCCHTLSPLEYYPSNQMHHYQLILVFLLQFHKMMHMIYQCFHPY